MTPEFTIIKKYSAARKKISIRNLLQLISSTPEKYNTLYNDFVNTFAAPGNVTATRRHLIPTAQQPTSPL
jgi:hypothetical protein